MNRHDRRKAAATQTSAGPNARILAAVPWKGGMSHPTALSVVQNPHHPGMWDACLHVGAFRSPEDAGAYIEKMVALLREEAGANLERRQ